MERNSTLTVSSVIHAKGLFSIFVLIHHINQELSVFDGTVLDLILNQLGYLSVAAFLFFSGYGLFTQHLKRDTYVKGMWKTRILSTYSIYLVVALLYFCTIAITKTTLSSTTIIRTFFFGGTVIRNGWYMQCQILMYLIFFITFRFIQKQKPQIFTLIALTSGYWCLCIVMKLEPMWYQAVPCFLLGIFWKMYESKIIELQEVIKHKLGKIGLMLTLFASGCGFLFFFATSKILTTPSFLPIILKIFSALTFVATVAIFLMKEKSINIPPINKIFESLGKYSMEIYVFHGLPLMLFRNRVLFIESDLTFTILVILSTAVLSLLLHPLFATISKAFKNPRIKKHQNFL